MLDYRMRTVGNTIRVGELNSAGGQLGLYGILGFVKGVQRDFERVWDIRFGIEKIWYTELMKIFRIGMINSASEHIKQRS